MRQFKATLIAPAVALSFAFMSLPSMAMGTAQETTQVMNNLQLIKTLAETVKIATDTAKVITDMTKQSTAAPAAAAAPNIADQMNKLAEIISKGNGLAFSAGLSAEQFQAKYPGFKADGNINKQYAAWSETLNNSIRNSLATAGLQVEQFATESDRLKALEQMSTTAVGRNQILQIGNQIALETATHMQKLRALTVAQMRAQDAYMANQEQKDASRKGGAEAIMPVSKAGDGKAYTTSKGGTLK